MQTSEKNLTGWYFLAFVMILYLITGFFQVDLIFTAFHFALKIFKSIIPVFIMIFILMFLINTIITPQMISRYIGQSSGIKKWLIAVIGGIISSGPIYMWYPMLKHLHEKGVSYGFIATFLYSRAIKLPLLPLIILYFGLRYTIILTFIMIVISIVQGVVFDRIKLNHIK